ncbi:unnamed protein product [marine sediment metagenome]|uniref:Uncharacterized protein n=1 Tax=marine sediment metagenome TaxID=412755 RepID=X1AMN6_9ZZZZ
MGKTKRYQNIKTRKKKLRKSRKKRRGGICSCTRRRTYGGKKLITHKQLFQRFTKQMGDYVGDLETAAPVVAVV